MGVGERLCGREPCGEYIMIRISQLKLPVGSGEAELLAQIRKLLRLKKGTPFTYKIVKKSIDARKKPDIYEVYELSVRLDQEEALVLRLNHPRVRMGTEVVYRPPGPGEVPMRARPVIVGAGPAGLFAAYLLAEAGFAPIVVERGRRVEERTRDVERFWETGVLDPCSNVQFGEGGAGTFSDGKLNTAVRDPSGRNDFVLETFVRFGAPEHILYESRPHIGTDVLARVIRKMRASLEAKGTEFHFETVMRQLIVEHGRCRAVVCGHLENTFTLETDAVILAPGHSARDTFRMLMQCGLPMEAKNFAVGFRVEHPQAMIDEAMYGRERGKRLPAAPYKLTANFEGGRGVYSFCMCPGGYVVNASSGEGHTVVNGMSYSGRNGSNANSAIIVTVTPEDFGSGPLAAVAYQERLEQENYRLGLGKIPQQLYGDYVQNVESGGYGAFASETKGAACFANLRGLLSAPMEQVFMQGMSHFAGIIANFDREDAILSGMETRTSSPLRILRNEHCESMVGGVYPCGEGAGYAGGIMSAAMDGLKVAGAILERYRPADGKRVTATANEKEG